MPATGHEYGATGAKQVFESVGRLFGNTPETIMAAAMASLVFVMACLVIVALVIGTLQLIYIKRGIDAMNENNRQQAAASKRQHLALLKLIEDGARNREAAERRSEQQNHVFQQQGLALQKLIEKSKKNREAADRRSEQQGLALQKLIEDGEKSWEATDRRIEQQGLALQKLIEDGEESREALAEAVKGLRIAIRDATPRQEAPTPRST